MAVFFEQVKRSASMEVKDVFQMEYGLSQAFLNHPDFYEGVRALIVDKDRNPRW